MILNIFDLKKISTNTIRNGIKPKKIVVPIIKNYVDRVTIVINNIEKDKENIKYYDKVYFK